MDVLAQIKADHDNVKSLFAKYKAASGSEKTTLAQTLITEIKAHSAAEDASIYADYAKFGLNAASNKQEHAEINKLVAGASASDDAAVTKAVTTFISHSDEEESQQWPTIKAKLSAGESDALAKQFVNAKKSVA
ncbi:hypothetical protein GLOTRDRAFT_127948 [Gloeophyllum trabeum ATCC 11539]|uniref:Hemerythrin-like domain-containing protein n=1 Tax=Gloeophyllum trabeum (strain ATCC 11539 / FP-39264 / Madison 617) TaxID=670483 RepID=S7RWB3_GLOTA|nr:uncharacterized protein GLOTRDRAFT_127948 [Gloeophyllum trabeum ATCC 11539]EPQ57594.1 hypothetical protein GLOTRDRAFT_127948 [Gloeophyllum trabeum ATCC 11539]